METTPIPHRSGPGSEPASDQVLNEVFGALANPTRRAILARLAGGGATVNELAAPFDMTLPAISKHIKVLEHAGLIVRGRDAQFRPCALNPPRLRQVAAWADQYRAIWETRFDQMDDYLARFHDGDGHGTPSADDTSADDLARFHDRYRHDTTSADENSADDTTSDTSHETTRETT